MSAARKADARGCMSSDTIAPLAGDGRRPFVHCVAAESRTPAVAAAYLYRHGSLTADEALGRVAEELGGPKNPYLQSLINQLEETP